MATATAVAAPVAVAAASVKKTPKMRWTQARKHQVCDHCGGRFGLVTHRWWGNKFCKKVARFRAISLLDSPSAINLSMSPSRALHDAGRLAISGQRLL